MGIIFLYNFLTIESIIEIYRSMLSIKNILFYNEQKIFIKN